MVAPAPGHTGAGGAVDQLRRLGELRDAGMISARSSTPRRPAYWVASRPERR